MASGEIDLLSQLRELHTALSQRKIVYCVIGGVAVNAHGAVRATHDLDLMLRAEDAPRARDVISTLGYRTLDAGREIESYVRARTRLDILLAQRSITLDLLARAQSIDYAGLSIKVIPLEGLLGLKIQAFNDDPRRLKDLQDIIDLVRLHRDDLKLDEVRAYFRLFDRETVLDDVLKSTRRSGTDRSEASG
jgi:predicted nucleotidyltransferase